MAKSLIDRKSNFSPTSRGEYAYYGKEQIILPNQLLGKSSPAKTPIHIDPIIINPDYVIKDYVLFGYVTT